MFDHNDWYITRMYDHIDHWNVRSQDLYNTGMYDHNDWYITGMYDDIDHWNVRSQDLYNTGMFDHIKTGVSPECMII